MDYNFGPKHSSSRELFTLVTERWKESISLIFVDEIPSVHLPHIGFCGLHNLKIQKLLSFLRRSWLFAFALQFFEWEFLKGAVKMGSFLVYLCAFILLLHHRKSENLWYHWVYHLVWYLLEYLMPQGNPTPSSSFREVQRILNSIPLFSPIPTEKHWDSLKRRIPHPNITLDIGRTLEELGLSWFSERSVW